jgi:hypothetical protein
MSSMVRSPVQNAPLRGNTGEPPPRSRQDQSRIGHAKIRLPASSSNVKLCLLHRYIESDVLCSLPCWRCNNRGLSESHQRFPFAARLPPCFCRSGLICWITLGVSLIGAQRGRAFAAHFVRNCRQRVRLQPQRAGTDSRIDTSIFPPCGSRPRFSLCDSYSARGPDRSQRRLLNWLPIPTARRC